MTARPATLAAAVVAMAVIGTGIAFVGLFLLAIAAGAIPFLDPVGGALGVAGLVGAFTTAVAIVTFAAAAGLWQRRAWGWAGSLAVAVSSVLGAVVALGTSGSQLPIQAGLVLTVGAVALLLAPRTRSAAGIG